MGDCVASTLLAKVKLHTAIAFYFNEAANK